MQVREGLGVRQADIGVGKTYTQGGADHRTVLSIRTPRIDELWARPGEMLCTYRVVSSNYGLPSGTTRTIRLRSFARWAHRESGKGS